MRSRIGARALSSLFVALALPVASLHIPAHLPPGETNEAPEKNHPKMTAQGINLSGATLQSNSKTKSASTNTATFSPQIQGAAAPAPQNLIPNPGFESGASGAPTSWKKGGYGTNTRTLTYPVTSGDGSKAARVQITSYTNGDAKWYFNPVSVPAGTYTYSDQYASNIQSILTVQFQNTNGSFSYKDIATLPASSAWKTISANFTVPAGTQNVTIFHLINRVGTLTIDNASLVSTSSTSSSVFSTGAVTLRFDDNRLSQYQNAIPKLQTAGLKGTFYVITQEIQDNGYSSYMSKGQIQEVAADGDEIGAHTRTHRDLTTLSAADQQSEIQGSRQDLLGWNVGPILSFAYPFGSYDATTIQDVKNAGYQSAAATIDGDVTPSSDPYQLERFGMTSDVTFAQTKAAIDNAIAKHDWIILAFHQVLPSCTEEYCTPTNVFNQVVDYLKSQNTRVVTISQGMQSIQ